VVAGADAVAGVVEGTREPVVAGGVLGEAVGDLHHAARIGDVPRVVASSRSSTGEVKVERCTGMDAP
jgi:hypothetical protein